MDITSLSIWLKTTIPGIILLGAIGSVSGVFLIWLLSKIAKLVWRKFVISATKVFGKNLFKFSIFYMRTYYVQKAIFLQLINKKKYLSASVYIQKSLSNRNIAWLFFITFSLVTIGLFVFKGTTYPKTSSLLVAITILIFHDAIALTIWCGKLGKSFYGIETEVAENTYKSKESVIIESAYSLIDLKNKQKTS